MLFYVRAIERGRLFAALALARLRSPAVACGRLRSPAVACGRLPAHAVAAKSGHLAAVRLDGRLLCVKVCVCWVFGVFGGLRETTRGAFRFTRRFRAATWDFHSLAGFLLVSLQPGQVARCPRGHEGFEDALLKWGGNVRW